MNIEKNTVQGPAEESAQPVVAHHFVRDDFPEFFRASDSTCYHPDGSLMDPPPGRYRAHQRGVRWGTTQLSFSVDSSNPRKVYRPRGLYSPLRYAFQLPGTHPPAQTACPIELIAAPPPGCEEHITCPIEFITH
jgi:hypothetical protein